MKRTIWIHWVFLGAIIIYLCLFSVEASKFLGGKDKKELSASLIEVTDSKTIAPVTTPTVFEIFWKQDGDKYIAGENTFKAEMQGLNSRIEISSDKNVSWKPLILLNNKEVTVINAIPSLLGTNDTLEWDYGICKRKIQLKNNSLIESYVFDQNPNGDVFIKYNTQGNIQPSEQYAVDGNANRVGQIPNGNEFQILKAIFNNAAYPIIINTIYSFD